MAEQGRRGWRSDWLVKFLEGGDEETKNGERGGRARGGEEGVKGDPGE